MFKKGYKQTEEHKRKISESKKGKKRPPFSEEWRKNLSEAHKKLIPWNKDLTKETDERVRKISDTKKGHIVSEETKRKQSIANSGKRNGMYGVHKFGKGSSNWIDGRSFEPYTQKFNKFLKENIKKIYNFECQLCYVNEKEHIKKYNKKISIHHIDYNKKNCSMKNLIVLCLKCNSKVNGNREYWKEFFIRKINND